MLALPICGNKNVLGNAEISRLPHGSVWKTSSPAEASLPDVNASASALSAISAPRAVLTMFAPSGNRAFCSADNGLMVSVVEEQLRDKTSLTGSRLPIES